MSLGKVAIFSVGLVAGGLIGYAATKSEAVQKASKATIKAGLKAKDWTVGTVKQAKDGVVSMVKSAKEENAVEGTA